MIDVGIDVYVKFIGWMIICDCVWGGGKGDRIFCVDLVFDGMVFEVDIVLGYVERFVGSDLDLFVD